MLDEIPVQFGPQGSLLGIVTRPQRGQSAVGCLLFNAGVLHRIGPHRINVKLARALAECGITSMRLDLSGVGDSPAAGGTSGDQALHDLRAAMDHLERTEGIERFVVLGICSGAVQAYYLAQADQRVAGVLMFDGFIYPTLKMHILRRWLRFRAMHWSRMPGTVLNRLVRIVRPRPKAATLFGQGAIVTPPPAEFRRVLDEVTARGVAVLIVYSGSFIEEYNYAGQLRDAFRGAPFLDRIQHAYMPDVDHTVTPLAAQRRLVELVCDWAEPIAAPTVRSPASRERVSL